MTFRSLFLPLLPLATLLPLPARAAPVEFSGIRPGLACFNDEGECGTGAVVPWADRLWVVTYAPHKPEGSSDKLYEITPDLRQIVRPESIGGTPANRMIHRESGQLFIGSYAIDSSRQVRVIPFSQMYGRMTGNARHLTDPAGKIYYATMEEGIYEVDVKTLAVTELWADEQRKTGRHADLPGYHGKGFYSGQGRMIYANNGDHAKEALSDPTVPSGVLAQWDGKADAIEVVRRNQFTEVTGPGGIYGNEHPATDPVWSVGWDHRSVILMCLDGGKWHSWRLPKASHSYDGAHGWNTEWPRIREIGDGEMLMTMHGTMWKFPKTFTAATSAGIAPRSNYLKVVGDFARWQDKIVLGCDDTAKSEFLNKRKVKGNLAGPGQSQSNLWFVAPAQLDHLGPVIGRGAVWMKDAVKAGVASDAFLFSGYARRSLCLTQQGTQPVSFTVEVDVKGDGKWEPRQKIEVPAGGTVWTDFPAAEQGTWIRLNPGADGANVTAFFHYRATDERPAEAAPGLFDGVARPGEKEVSGGVMLTRGNNLRTLRFVASTPAGELGAYDLDAEMNLKKVDDAAGLAWTREKAAIPHGVLSVDAASVIYTDDKGRPWRLPKGDAAFDQPGALGDERVCREVCTERDLFNAHGTFYELPAENAGGFIKVRPVATHNRRIKDYASYRGLLLLSGITDSAKAGDHIIRSDDGKCALWAGAVDDLWQLGKPRGLGGPWKDTAVKAGVPSDPYLMTGYDRKHLTLANSGPQPATLRVELDVTGTGEWVSYRTFDLKAGESVSHDFSRDFGAYWLRVVSTSDTTATAQLKYE